jgi:hypothetical protein
MEVGGGDRQVASTDLALPLLSCPTPREILVVSQLLSARSAELLSALPEPG